MAAAPLSQSMYDDGPSIYYNPLFRETIEYHLEWLKTRPKTIIAEIQMNQALRHEYDLFGFLTEIKVPAYLQWIVMRVNDMTSPTEFRTTSPHLIIPDSSDIDELRTTFTTVHKI